jgi:excisionase family DNA binding protein
MEIERQTVTVEEAATILGVGRNKAYEAARSGEIPTIRIGKRLLVPVASLERLLAVGAQPLANDLTQPEKASRECQ